MNYGGIDEIVFEVFLVQQDRYIFEVFGLCVVDVQGIICYVVNDIRVSNVSIVDCLQFICLCDDFEVGLVFFKLMMGCVVEKWLIMFGCWINNLDGIFVGDVYVVVVVDYFIVMFLWINLGLQGNIGFWDYNSLIVCYVRNDVYGVMVGNVMFFDQLCVLFDFDQKVVVYYVCFGVDGIICVFYFWQVVNYLFYLIVGLVDEDYLV